MNPQHYEPQTRHYPASGIPPRPDTSIAAEQCMKWLKVQGFEVLCVQSSRNSLRNPRITIRTSPLCEKLEGAVRMYERGPQGERRYCVATRFGCEIRWTDEGGSHAKQ